MQKVIIQMALGVAWLISAFFASHSTCYGAVEAPLQPDRISIVIDMEKLTLTIFNRGEPYRQYPVAMGRYESPTPVGNWVIISKDASPPAHLGSRWLGLNIPYGEYGIHGTNEPGSIGSYASHGCIRMFNSDIEEIFDVVITGTPVTIIGTPFGAPGTPAVPLKYGDKGPAVLEVQRALKRLGYIKFNPDGFWGEGTEKAVLDFKRDNGLSGPAAVDEEVYTLLGF